MASVSLASAGAEEASRKREATGEPPVAMLSAKPTTINPGQWATLAYASTNADFCKGSSRPYDPSFNVYEGSGSVRVRPTRTTTYTIRCKKGAASTARRVVVTVTSDPIVLSEIFDGAVPRSPETVIQDGELLAPKWKSVYHGFGSNSVVRQFDGIALSIRPREARSPNETHAGLIAGPFPSWPVDIQGNFAIEASLHTEKQLRLNAPNAWEAAWLLWDYIDNRHFYYFVPKPNGWELGKEDPAYPGDQRFLASGTRPIYPIGNRYLVKIVQSASPNSTTLSVFVDGVLLTTVTDLERPYSSGLVGFYSEDALVYFHSIVVTRPHATPALKSSQH